jgi:hypothetical protein
MDPAVDWYWIAVVVGIMAPWIASGRELGRTFKRDPIKGSGVWFMLALSTTPLVLSAALVVQLSFE